MPKRRLRPAWGKEHLERGDARWLPPNISDKMNAALADLGE